MDSLNSLRVFWGSQNRISKGGIWAAIGKFSALFLGIIINMLLARLLTPEEMGSYVLTFSIVNLGAVIGQLGLGRTSVKLVAESMGLGQPGRARRSISMILKLTVLGAFIAALFVSWGGERVANVLFHSQLVSDSIALAALWAVVITVKSVLVEIFRGFHWILHSEIFTDLGLRLLAAPALTGLWFANEHITFEQAVLLILVVTTIITLVGLFLLGRHVNTLPRQYQEAEKEPTIRTVLLNSSNVWFSMLLLSAQGHAVVWLLAAYTSPGEVALYYAAFQLASLIGFFLLVLQSVFPPVIAEMYARQSISDLEVVLQKGAFFSMLPSALIFLIILIGGQFLLPLIYGEYYRAAYSFLMIISFGQIVNVWTGLCGETLFQTGHQNLMFINTLIGIGIEFIVSLLLLKFFGSLGVVIGFAFSTIVMNVLALIFVRIQLGIWTYARIRTVRSIFSPR